MKLSGEVKSILEGEHRKVLESIRGLYSEKQKDYEHSRGTEKEFDILRHFYARELMLIMESIGKLEALEAK